MQFKKKIYNLSEFSLKEVSGARKAWNDWGFFYWVYRVTDARSQAKWSHTLIHKESINKGVLGIFDILIGCLDMGKA